MPKPPMNNKRRRRMAPVKPAPKNLVFDYKDPRSLYKFLQENGAIAGRDKSGLSSKQQKELAKQVKRARHLAMLPFTQTV